MARMVSKPTNPARKAQFDRFVEAAKKLATDESVEALEAKVRKIAKASAKPKKPVKNTGK